MKYLAIILEMFMAYAASGQCVETAESFNLTYVVVGSGGNMWEMQPVFRVTRSGFIYTMEDVWTLDGVESEKPDTILTGILRVATIDSILNLITDIKGDTIYRQKSHITSGAIITLAVSCNNRRLIFELHNANDPTAEKIVDILNGYIPGNCQRLWVSDCIPDIICIQ